MNETSLPEVIVEFPMESGVRQVARSPEELAKSSAEALDRAMDTIRAMAARTRAGIDALVDKPEDVQIAFGIKLTAEAGAIISKVGGEAALQVTLAWRTQSSR